MDRQTELEANLREVNRDIDAACQKYGRDRSEVRLIVVTKTWPASDVELLAKLGVNDVGENRDQEAKPKHSEVKANLTWHAIGQLQTNKAKSVATWADVVHSVDRIDLVNALAKAVTSRQTPLRCLIQVNLDPKTEDGESFEHRGGADQSQVLELAKLISSTPNLELAGVMGVGPLDGDPESAFMKLKNISTELISLYPDATWISAGMSGDYELAIKHGATHLRIGSSILGHRAYNG